MFKTLLILPVLALVLCLTNPSRDRHHDAVVTEIRLRVAAGDLQAGAALLNLVGWQYNNYWIFSTSSHGDKQVSLGFLGFVFVGD